MRRSREQRSEEAKAYRHLYDTAQWLSTRERQLTAQPWCEMCLPELVPARVCDHVINHKGDRVLFFKGPFQSLCRPHHDAAKQKQERAGYSAVPGPDGWPVDPAHPANFGELQRIAQRYQGGRGSKV